RAKRAARRIRNQYGRYCRACPKGYPVTSAPLTRTSANNSLRGISWFTTLMADKSLEDWPRNCAAKRVRSEGLQKLRRILDLSLWIAPIALEGLILGSSTLFDGSWKRIVTRNVEL